MWDPFHELEELRNRVDRLMRSALPGGGEPGAGRRDIGRRVAAERTRLGLARTETARRAGMAPEYLAYLEERTADPTVASLINLAAALGTSVEALRGGGLDVPPGQGRALLHAQLRDLGQTNAATGFPLTEWDASRCRPPTARRWFR